MTSQDIENLINVEISGNWERSNAHGVDLKQCLVKPIKEKYYSFDKSEIKELWTVLEETPDRKNYKVFYDEEENCFGLGVLTNKDELINIGLYGDFINTLECM